VLLLTCVCALGRLQKLQRLDVNSNQLATVPPEIAQIRALEKIDISVNPVVPAINEAAMRGGESLLDFLRSEEYDRIYWGVSLILRFSRFALLIPKASGRTKPTPEEEAARRRQMEEDKALFR
jgi:hypothetical protein